MQQRPLLVAPLAVVLGLISGCGGTTTISFSNVTPDIFSISPSSIPAGAANFSLTITGTGLLTTSVVHFGNDSLSPSSLSPTNCLHASGCENLLVTVPAKDVSSPGPVDVSVSNSALLSGHVTFSVTSSTPAVAGAPAVVTFSPMAAPAGGPSFSLAIAAFNVASGATINFGSLSLMLAQPVPCQPSSLCTLQVQVPASAIASAQTLPLSITNPGSSGGTSAAISFMVFNTSQFPIEVSVNNANPPRPPMPQAPIPRFLPAAPS